MLCGACDGSDTHTHTDLQSYTYTYIQAHPGENWTANRDRETERADMAEE